MSKVTAVVSSLACGCFSARLEQLHLVAYAQSPLEAIERLRAKYEEAATRARTVAAKAAMKPRAER